MDNDTNLYPVRLYGASYGTNWTSVRRAAVERSKGICEKCHRVPYKEVHHILPVRFFACPSDANDLKNVIALCRKCHGKAHADIRKNLPLFDEMLSSWRRFSQTPIADSGRHILIQDIADFIQRTTEHKPLSEITADDLRRDMELEMSCLRVDPNEIWSLKYSSAEYNLSKNGLTARIRITIPWDRDMRVYAIVDANDLELATRYNLSGRLLYGKIRVIVQSMNGRSLGRLLLNITDPSLYVYQLNRDSLDYRRSNLEVKTKGQRNRK